MNFNINNQIKKSLSSFSKSYVYIQNTSFWRCIFLLAGFFLIAGVIFILNFKTYIHLDDYTYSYIFTTFDKIKDFSDLMESQKIHYNEWGGRFVVHSILQALLTLSPLLIDILNTLVFLIFVLCLYYHAKGRGKHSVILFLGMFFLTWVLQPVFADTVFWITGSVNYLWGTTIILLFLLPYRFYDGSTTNTRWMLVYATISLLFGVVAGWTTENTSAGMIVMIAAYMAYYKSNNWKIPVWSITGLIGSVIGYIALIIAPGNMVRAGDGMVTPLKVAFNIFAATQSFFTYLGVFFLFVIVLYVLFANFTEQRAKISMLTAIYILGMFVAIYSMILSPSFPARSWFGPISFAIISFGIVFYNLDSNYNYIKLIKTSFFLVGFFLFVFSFYDAYKDVSAMEACRIERAKLIEDAKERGDNEIVLVKFKPKTKFALLDASFSDKYMSHIYGIKISFEQ